MIGLENINWQIFKIGDIMQIENCKCQKVSILKDGDTPYVGATNNNNGVLKFVERKESLLTKGNCIVFICDGEGSIGLSVYKHEDFIGTTTVKVGRCPQLNRYNAMFITTVADTVRGKYNFGYKRNEKNLKRETIMLPATAEGTPDWQFMEAYMKQQEQAILKPTIERLCKQLITNELMGGGELSNLTWKEFYFTDIFTEIQRGKRIKKADHKLGNTPYVSSTANSNGIDGFLGNESSVRRFENCLTLANSGSVGSAFFHSYEFVASDHVTKLKREGLDKYAYLFMIPIINRLSEKYGFNREINDERIKREKIILPANEDGQPDFAFMSSFMQQIEKDILGTTLRYFADKQLITPRANNEINWQHFYIRDIFTLLEAGKSKGLNHLKKDKRGISYLGATNLNNAVLDFVQPVSNMIQKGNCIAFIRNGEGSMGYSVYKEEDFIATSDITVGYNKNLNKYNAMFITTVADRIRGKYNFGYKRSAQRLTKEILTLPVTPEGTPDWQYMESYMRHIESQQIVKYLQHYTKYIAY